jgi:hypothetical protein
VSTATTNSVLKQVLGSDLSQPMLDHVEKRGEDNGWKCLSTKIVDGNVCLSSSDAQSRFEDNNADSIQDMSMLEKNQFTHVLCTFGIFMLPNALSGLHSVTKSGGFVGVTTWKSLAWYFSLLLLFFLHRTYLPEHSIHISYLMYDVGCISPMSVSTKCPASHTTPPPPKSNRNSSPESTGVHRLSSWSSCAILASQTSPPRSYPSLRKSDRLRCKPPLFEPFPSKRLRHVADKRVLGSSKACNFPSRC